MTQGTAEPTTKHDQPIPGPSQVGPVYLWQHDHSHKVGYVGQTGRFFASIIRSTVEYIRENIVEANRGPKYYWYHKKFKRALPIDECYYDDKACIYEANLEYRRNALVDKQALILLKLRHDNCRYYHSTDDRNLNYSEACDPLYETYLREEMNYFIKYGELKFGATVLEAFNKQKHRMIMERRAREKNARLQPGEEPMPVPYEVQE